MNFMLKFWLTFIIVNLLLIDSAVVVTDSELREFRDDACSALHQYVKTPAPPADATYGFVLNHPATVFYDMIQINFWDQRNNLPKDTLHLYGCDVNDHRYRLWIQKGKP